jgi:hypothetical protein
MPMPKTRRRKPQAVETALTMTVADWYRKRMTGELTYASPPTWEDYLSVADRFRAHFEDR